MKAPLGRARISLKQSANPEKGELHKINRKSFWNQIQIMSKLRKKFQFYGGNVQSGIIKTIGRFNPFRAVVDAFIFYRRCRDVRSNIPAIWVVRECRQFPVKFHEKLKQASTLDILLKPLVARPHVGCMCLFLKVFYFVFSLCQPL